MTKTTASILKMKMNYKLPSAGKRSQSSFRLPLPPSLMKLPTISSTSDTSTSDSDSTSDTSDSTSEVVLSPRNSSWSNNAIQSLDLELNETRLDEWLTRLNEVAKASQEERNTTYIKRKASKVSFATSSIAATTIATLSQSSSAPVLSPSSPLEQQRPANKRRRFARRNSFVVRDIAQLVGLTKTHDM